MRDKILYLLSGGDFVSGEKLAEHLDVSRTAIWKQIKNLKELGYEIETIKNKGYRLVSRPDIPIAEEITSGLDTKIVGKEVHYFKSLSSTNLYAKKLVEDGATEGTIVVADIQTSGRGRKDRKWSSPKGGLWFSVILYPHIPPHHGMLVTMLSSVSIAQGIREVTGLSSVIKWPNDLLLNGKKVCGVLTELDAEMDRINYTVVGIGINVNNLIDEKLQNTAISLIQKNGSKISKVKLLRSILKYLDENYNRLLSGDYGSIRDLWFSHANIIGKRIRIKGEKTVIEGTVSNVDDSGCLILDTGNRITRIVSGDVEYL
ncbi:MAG: biotin--[acetyl-CoA-carboxylase] ligase [Candidatus Thermoplasmatota archaeon]|nr:biotin--[acetyl-CoA-carboxylase] ligase [Candidatus Thermoplasmatota archaeon]